MYDGTFSFNTGRNTASMLDAQTYTWQPSSSGSDLSPFNCILPASSQQDFRTFNLAGLCPMTNLHTQIGLDKKIST